MLLGGIIADRTPHHERVAAIGFACTSTMAVLMGWVNMPAAVLIFVMSLGGLLNGMIQPSRDMMVRAVTPPGSFGKVFGFVTTGFNLGGMVAPLLYAWLMDRGEPRMIFVIVVVFILLALVTAMTRRKPQGTTGMDSLTPATAVREERRWLRRYGADALPAAGPWNEMIATMLDHRSVRGYKPDPVPAGTLETMIAAAQSAATSSNMQWTVGRRRHRSRQEEGAGRDRRQPEAHRAVPALSLLGRRHDRATQRISTAEKIEFETMPWLETFMVACIDVALAAQNAVVAAESIGLSTVYIGAMRNDPERVAELLGLPPQAFVVFGLCVGYADRAGRRRGEAAPAADHRAAPRALRRRRTRGPGRQAYDAEMSKFSARHELQAATWTQRVLNRLGPIKSMNGRESMRAALAKLGFEIR